MNAGIIDTNRFAPYGEPLDPVAKNARLTNSPFGFTGEMHDIEGGLIYLRARYFEPQTMQFLQQDTVLGDIKQPLTRNLYLYANGNPLTYVDPSGHLAEVADGVLYNHYNDTYIYGEEVVKYGDTGTKARQVQTMLVTLRNSRYSLPKYGVDGSFGNETLRAVNNFKNDTSINNTGIWEGIVDQKTRNKLVELTTTMFDIGESVFADANTKLNTSQSENLQNSVIPNVNSEIVDDPLEEHLSLVHRMINQREKEINPYYYSQTDPRWRAKMYSSKNDKSQTMGYSGCGPTSLAMVIKSMINNRAIYQFMAKNNLYDKEGNLQEFNPYTVAQYAMTHEREEGKYYRTSNSGTHASLFKEYAKQFGIDTIKEGTTDFDFVKEKLSYGNHVAIVNVGKGIFTGSGHYMVLTGVSTDENGAEWITVYDPYQYNHNYLDKSKDPFTLKDSKEIQDNIMLTDEYGIIKVKAEFLHSQMKNGYWIFTWEDN